MARHTRHKTTTHWLDAKYLVYNKHSCEPIAVFERLNIIGKNTLPEFHELSIDLYIKGELQSDLRMHDPPSLFPFIFVSVPYIYRERVHWRNLVPRVLSPLPAKRRGVAGSGTRPWKIDDEVGVGISSAFYFFWKGFVSSTSNEK